MTADAALWLEGLQALSQQQDREPPLVRLAKVAPDHAGGNPRLVFDGEASPTSKGYPRLVDVAAGQRVVCLRAGSTYVVVGALR